MTNLSNRQLTATTAITPLELFRTRLDRVRRRRQLRIPKTWPSDREQRPHHRRLAASGGPLSSLMPPRRFPLPWTVDEWSFMGTRTSP